MNSSKLSYRAEIDGLRAIAVISVILYHSQMVLFGRDWFKGGFIGVDIFFVISGYLITRIILSELQAKGSFSFLNFYERRARRILPMLFVVIFVSIPYVWQKLLPSDFVEYAESILSSLFFGSNVFFYFSTTEYGADSALLKPFLHTWSLGVEEQFYLVFPILAILAFKFFRNHFLTILVALSLCSLQFAELMEVRNSDLNFYLPFSRFWELAVGSVLAYRELNLKALDDGFGRRVLPMLGLCLVAYGILFFDGETPHPSFYTLIPILGVALIIGFASKDELIGKILGSQPFVWIGLISYSAYLWHFPIFSFARIEYGIDLSEEIELLLISLVFILSAASYFLIEKPFRSGRIITSAYFFIQIFIASILIILFSAFIIFNNGFEKRFPKVNGFEFFEIDNGKLRLQSWGNVLERNLENPLFKDVKNRILIVGNSHSKDFYNAVISSNIYTSDYDVMTVYSDLSDPKWHLQIHCFDESNVSFSKVRDDFYGSSRYKDASQIIIATKYGAGKCGQKNKSVSSSEDINGLPYILKRAKSDGKSVVIVGNTAEFNSHKGKYVADSIYEKYKNDPNRIYKAYFDKVINPEARSIAYQSLKNKQEINLKLEMIANEFGIPFIDRVTFLCSELSEICEVFTKDGGKISYDYGHWTLEGAQFVGDRISMDNLLVNILLGR